MGSLPAGHMPGVNESFRLHVLRLLLPETRAEAVLPPSQPLQIASTRVAFTRRKRGRGSSPFKKSTRRILENVRGNYVVLPGIQPEAMVSDDLRVEMKRAAADISRSKFEVYNFATRHGLSDAAFDELLQMLSNVGNIMMAILFTIVVFVRKISVLPMILN